MTLTITTTGHARLARSPRELVGHTPLLQLGRMFGDHPFEVYAKLEKANPGGSIKDRAALAMLEGALSRGELVPGVSTVVESSSGNLGIALAQLCPQFGLRFVCVTDLKATSTNVALMRALGAEVIVVTEPDAATGEYLPARLARVAELRRTLPNAWWPNQYANLDNPAAHAGTAGEIIDTLGTVDWLVCATGTCGTLRGMRQHLRVHSPHTTVVAVDALGSAIFDGQPGVAAPVGHVRRLVPGHGAAVVPPLMAADLADVLVRVSDRDCVRGCRELQRTESLLVGGSSGAALTAIHRIAPSIPAGSIVAVILPDGGERYLDTIHNDAWVARWLGDLPTTAEWARPDTTHVHDLTGDRP